MSISLKSIIIVILSSLKLDLEYLILLFGIHFSCKLSLCPNNPKSSYYLSSEAKTSIRSWLSAKSASNYTRKCQLGRVNSSTGFRQRNLASFRKGSTTSFVSQQQIFVKGSNSATDSERLTRLEFNVQQMDHKMNELDLKLDMILKSIMKPE